MDSVTLGYAFLGGLLPSLVWLYFLLREDSRCPEPRGLILFAFVVGMLAVPLALWPENLSCARLAIDALRACHPSGIADQTLGTLGPRTLIAWATIEELLKYGMAAVFILWRRAIDETPDYVIYMITTALGFAAAETMLFVFSSISLHGVEAGLATSDLRFIGPVLVHIAASGTVGLSLALSVRMSGLRRTVFAALGLILAIALHAGFNALMIREGGPTVLAAFFLVWLVVLILLAAFEILKYVRYRNLPKNTC